VVTSTDLCAAIIVLHKSGHRCKEISAKGRAPERTVYNIFKNLKERDSTVVKRASGRPKEHVV